MSKRKRRAIRFRRCARCGFTRTYKDATVAEANRWFGKHSCQKIEDSWVRSEQYRARMALIDRTPVDLPEGKSHGYAGYRLYGCRCLVCSNARAAYDDNRNRMIAYGRWVGWVDADAVRAHLAALREFGIGTRVIAELSGVSRSSLKKITDGWQGREPCKRVHRSTAERIFAVEPVKENLPNGTYIPTAGATRRVQALIALGWSGACLANELGVARGNFTDLLHGRRDVTVKRDRDVRKMYERLSMTLPPETNQRQRISASRARSLAKANGWAPPLAWDDDQLDDPAARPTRSERAARGLDHAVVERYLASGERPRGRAFSHDEAAEIVRRLRLRGESTHVIERRGFKPQRYTEAS